MGGVVMADKDLELQPLISPEQIAERIKEFADKLDHDYRDKDLVIVMIMKGAICFVSDMIRQLKINPALDFIYCSSYTGAERGDLNVYGLDNIDIEGKDVLIIDDIFDSGTTVRAIIESLEEYHVKSISTMVLLLRKMEKPQPYRPEYVLFEVEQEAFVVGYGLDYHERYRGLPGISFVKSMPSEL